MTSTELWDYPSDQDVRGYGECRITVVLPPFAPYAPLTPESPLAFAPHDPAKARAFAEALPTVEAVLEELPLADAGPEHPHTRADLEEIRVGHWGNVIAVADYSLADNGLDIPLLEQTQVLAGRFPEARITGSAHLHRGETHEETVIHLPGGLMLHTEGWPAADPFHVDGDPHAIVRELGITKEALERNHVDLDDEPGSVSWSSFGELLLHPFEPWGYEALAMSRFRVRHTEDSVLHMNDVWFEFG